MDEELKTRIKEPVMSKIYAELTDPGEQPRKIELSEELFSRTDPFELRILFFIAKTDLYTRSITIEATDGTILKVYREDSDD